VAAAEYADLSIELGLDAIRPGLSTGLIRIATICAPTPMAPITILWLRSGVAGTAVSIQLALDAVKSGLSTFLIGTAGAAVRTTDTDASNHDTVANDRKSAR
jgi:hypothetical protein